MMTLTDDGRQVVVRAPRPLAGGHDPGATKDSSNDSKDSVDSVVAVYVYRPAVPPEESPRPYLHPVRTLRGVVVTDFRPADHRWHHGLSLALPYVGGANLWGGPTYDGATGRYEHTPVNGSMRHQRLRLEQDGFVEDLGWYDAQGRPIGREVRAIRFTLVDGGWALSWQSVIENVTADPWVIGSPATHGRVGAGYGGIFWRAAPAFTGCDARTGLHAWSPGDDLSGTTSPDLTIRGGQPGQEALLALSGGFRAGEASAEWAVTPWFVRSDEYPGFGPAPFSQAEHSVEPGARASLLLRATILDETLDG